MPSLCTRPWITLCLAAFIALGGCASTDVPNGITPVKPFELSRYEGRWYEMARLDHRFERGMTDVTAQYQKQADGSVRVVNRGFEVDSDKWREAIGKALFTGDPDTASLKVSFFGPFYGGYHVAALDPNYQWAIVVGPDRSYCWILSRTAHVSKELRNQWTKQVAELGIDTQALIWVSHERQDPTLQR